jgi:oligoribonuclease
MLGIFLDLETNGLDVTQHRIIDFACKIVDLETMELKGELQSVIRQPEDIWEASDPSSLKVNGYTWERVCTGISEAEINILIKQLWKKLQIRRGDAVYICQNPSFDRPYFAQLVPIYEQEKKQWPYHWLDFASMHWALALDAANKEGSGFPKNIPLSKDSIALAHKLPTEAKPHKAMNGVDHLLMLYSHIVAHATPE